MTKPTRLPSILRADPTVPYPQITGSEPCRSDPDAWFPDQGNNGAAAQLLCRTHCPVLEQCRQWALTNPQLASDGIWGGLSRTQRDTERRKHMSVAA